MVSPFPRFVQGPPGPALPLILPFPLSVVWKTCQVFLVALVFPGMIGLSCAAATEKRAFELEQTMLMFVGEELGVLTIASRREESALQAPAIAQVVTRREIREQGATTLSQVLERVPGFHMAQRESGTEPYLRGIPNSILFLHDAVPLISETTKSIHPLDHELSLAAVKRIEIIRGPGSALWGPDAFAGIVNVVPLTGKDLDGLETGLIYGEPGFHKGFYVNAGRGGRTWDGFFSVAGRKGEEDESPYTLLRFWGDGNTPTPPEDRYGSAEPGSARYLEAYGRLAYKDRLIFSSRVAESERPYTMGDETGNTSWRESRDLGSGYLKMEARSAFNSTATLRATGIYSWLHPEFQVIDRTLAQKENTSYGEGLYDQSLFSGRGLFSAGVSYRKKEVRNAPVWNGYFLDFLDPGNRFFLPIITREDYATRLWSVFGQYHHTIGKADFWLSLRSDDHDQYQDHLSYNAGVVWSPLSDWKIKLLYGTAYRTPFARQLLSDEVPDLEKIKSLNLQLAWNPTRRSGVTLTGFYNRLRNHINEDPYAGLSEPNRQDTLGAELEGKFALHRTLDLGANLTLIHNRGPDETYRYNDFSYIDEDGNLVRNYVDLSYPYDAGANRLFNLFAFWRPHERFTGFARLGYFSSQDLIFPVAAAGENSVVSYPGVWLVDLAATLREVLGSGTELRVSVRNLTDREYRIPGTYSAMEGRPFTFEAAISKKW